MTRLVAEPDEVPSTSRFGGSVRLVLALNHFEGVVSRISVIRYLADIRSVGLGDRLMSHTFGRRDKLLTGAPGDREIVGDGHLAPILPSTAPAKWRSWACQRKASRPWFSGSLSERPCIAITLGGMMKAGGAGGLHACPLTTVARVLLEGSGWQRRH